MRHWLRNHGPFPGEALDVQVYGVIILLMCGVVVLNLAAGLYRVLFGY